MTRPTTKLGRTGLEVSRLCYGSMELRGADTMWGTPLADGQADQVLNAALDAGVDIIDTSPDYGEAEEHIGRSIGHRRDEYVLMSKCGCPLDAGGDAASYPPHDFSRRNVRACAEQSLRRLRTDHLDVLQVHMSPSRAEMERDDTIAELAALRDEGKVRFLGMSGQLPELTDHVAMGVFDVFQIPYSALERACEGVIGDAARSGAGTVVRGAVARPIEAPTDTTPGMFRAALTPRHERLARAGLDEIAGGMPLAELLLRFILTHPDVDVVNVGTTKVAHLESNVAAASNGPLPAELYEAVKARLA